MKAFWKFSVSVLIIVGWSTSAHAQLRPSHSASYASSHISQLNGTVYIIRGGALYSLKNGSQVQFGDRIMSLKGSSAQVRLMGHCDVYIPQNVAVTLSPQICAPNYQFSHMTRADYRQLKNLGQYQGTVAAGTPGSIPVTGPAYGKIVAPSGSAFSGAGLALGAAVLAGGALAFADDDDTAPRISP